MVVDLEISDLDARCESDVFLLSRHNMLHLQRVVGCWCECTRHCPKQIPKSVVQQGVCGVHCAKLNTSLIYFSTWVEIWEFGCNAQLSQAGDHALCLCCVISPRKQPISHQKVKNVDGTTHVITQLPGYLAISSVSQLVH